MASRFNPTAFAEKLRRMDATQPSVVSLSRYMQMHVGHIPEMAAAWLTEFMRSPPELQLALLYLVNEVLQTSRKSQATGAAFTAAFMAGPLPQAMAVVAAGGGPNEAKARRVVIILRDRNVLAPPDAAALLAALDDPDKVLDSAAMRAAGGNADAAAMMMLVAGAGVDATGFRTPDADGGPMGLLGGGFDGGLGRGAGTLSPLSLMEREVMPAAGVPLPALQAAAVAAADQLTVASAAPSLSRAGAAAADALFRALGVPPQLQPLSDTTLLRAAVAAAAAERAEAASAFSRDDVAALRPVLERAFVAEQEIAASVDPATGAAGVTKAALLAQSLPLDAGAHTHRMARHVAALRAEKRARTDAVAAAEAAVAAQMALQEADTPQGDASSAGSAGGEVASALAEQHSRLYDRLRSVRRKLQSAHDAAAEREHEAAEAAEAERLAARRAEAAAAVAEVRARREAEAAAAERQKSSREKNGTSTTSKSAGAAARDTAAVPDLAAPAAALKSASAASVPSNSSLAAAPKPATAVTETAIHASTGLNKLEQLLGRARAAAAASSVPQQLPAASYPPTMARPAPTSAPVVPPYVAAATAVPMMHPNMLPSLPPPTVAMGPGPSYPYSGQPMPFTASAPAWGPPPQAFLAQGPPHYAASSLPPAPLLYRGPLQPTPLSGQPQPPAYFPGGPPPPSGMRY